MQMEGPGGKVKSAHADTETISEISILIDALPLLVLSPDATCR